MDSTLIYEKISVPNEVAMFFNSAFVYRNNEDEIKTHVVFPDGLFDIILMEKDKRIIGGLLFGIWSRPIHVEIPAKTTVIGISCKPLAAEYYLGYPVAHIFNSSEPYLKNDFGRIAGESFDCMSFIGRLVEDAGRMTKNVEGRKMELFNLIDTTKGQISVEEIAARVYWSERQMNRYFNNWLGLSLKSYLNIVKCCGTYPFIKQGQLCAPLGYFDQSHFIKEVKRFTGLKPKDLYRNAHNSYLQFSVMNSK